MASTARRVVALALGRLVLVQRRERLDAHAEDVALDVARERLELVRGVHAGGHGEDLVELFERERLGLGDEEQDEDEADDVPAGVPPEGALRLERAEQTGEGDRDDEVAGRSWSACVWNAMG